MAVFVAHLLATFGIGRLLFVDLKHLGWAGVLLFFVHTSLVLMMSMERLRATGWRLLASFYVRRVFRIYPLSIFCVAAVVLLRIPSMPWVPAFLPVSWGTFAANALLIQNLMWKPDVIGALWSLPLEIEMYVMLPFLFLAARRYASPALALGLWLLFVPLGLLIPRFHQLQIGGIGIFQYIPCFLGGVMAYLAAARVPAKRAFWLWPVSILGFIAIYLVSKTGTRGWIECLLLGVAVPQFRETDWAWLKKVSHIVAQHSYGIYLLHPPVMWFAFRKLHTQPAGVQWSVFVLLMVIGCYAAYRWIESPLMKAGGNLAKRFQAGKSW